MRPQRAITDLDDPAFTRLFTEFEHSAWRLETLQAYDVTYEQDAFDHFSTNGEADALIEKAMEPWVENVVRPAVEAGKYIGRVHVVENLEPGSNPPVFTDYIRFEFQKYKHSIAAGEDVRLIVSEPGHRPKDVTIPSLHNDFWLFDCSKLVEMQYEPDGTFKQAVINNELTYASAVVWACKIRDAATLQSTPLQF